EMGPSILQHGQKPQDIAFCPSKIKERAYQIMTCHVFSIKVSLGAWVGSIILRPGSGFTWPKQCPTKSASGCRRFQQKAKGRLWKWDSHWKTILIKFAGDNIVTLYTLFVMRIKRLPNFYAVV